MNHWITWCFACQCSSTTTCKWCCTNTT